MDREEAEQEPSGAARFVVSSIELHETDEHIVITGDLPPHEKVDRIAVSVNESGMSLCALLDHGKDAFPQYRACTFGTFARLFRLRKNGKGESPRAAVVDGVLQVLIPKALL